MTATTTNNAVNNANTSSTKAEYFNLNIKSLGYLSNIRRIETLTGSFLSVVINALSGPTDSPTYVRFDATVAGKEATDLISRCQKAVDEAQKMLLRFTLSNLTSDIFTLNKGDHAGEQRVSLKTRLIKVDWIKIGQQMVYKTEKSEPSLPNERKAEKTYSADSF
ncbi:STY4534 family ICE replication protein [Pantoea allii]|uniref:STY4534 family ICE replication protein n=1 Tax=Pantoea allii TaxID=574096 RepID=UPI003D7AE1F5